MAAAAADESRPPAAGAVMLSKKRYAALVSVLRKEFGEAAVTVDSMLPVLCDALGFDPSANSYTPKQAAAMRAWRAKKSAEGRARGLTTYDVLGGRAAYERSKGRKAAATVNAV